ncbi:MAG: hypothetical protein EA417_22250 [Gammaproteobacteria bacterium]|nr:MAG: hypothetical protein EA417_22250 [Gammaproteobacteria bacterium]
MTPPSIFVSTLRVLAAGLLALVVTACGGNIEEEIIGKWVERDGPERIEFDEDGSVVLHFEGMELEGRYEFLARDKVLLDLRGPRVTSDPIEAPVSIDDDVLSFTMPDGRVATYSRAD